MTNAELLELVGFAFASWAFGFGLGWLVTSFKKFADTI